jgi:hypothetical protein
LLGSGTACLFETPFLEHAACQRSEDCDPAWGEKREAYGCYIWQPEENTRGYCARTGCEQDSDCVAEESNDIQLVCRGVPMSDAQESESACLIGCEDEQDCPDDMECGTQDGLCKFAD